MQSPFSNLISIVVLLCVGAGCTVVAKIGTFYVLVGMAVDLVYNIINRYVCELIAVSVFEYEHDLPRPVVIDIAIGLSRNRVHHSSLARDRCNSNVLCLGHYLNIEGFDCTRCLARIDSSFVIRYLFVHTRTLLCIRIRSRIGVDIWWRACLLLLRLQFFGARFLGCS